MGYYVAILFILLIIYYIYMIFFHENKKTTAVDEVTEEVVIYELSSPTKVNDTLIFESPTSKGGSLPLKLKPSSEKKTHPETNQNNTNMKPNNHQSAFMENIPQQAKGTLEYYAFVDLHTATSVGATMFNNVAR